ncbi:MAG TPA: OmpA family protein, partial [Terriglobales bacterium]|nr:OmpA family protein [Terriglobales bacterium]
DGNAELNVTTNLQAFGLIVTAEPYFAVTAPSDLIVANNVISQKTQGWAQPIHAKFEAMNRREYTVDIPASELPATTADRKKVPLELLEARNAIAIAKASGAQQYAPDALQRAEDFIAKGEDYLHRDQGKGPIGTVARYAAQQAEDARVLTIRRKEQEQADNQRREMQQRTEEARQRAQDEADRARQAQEQRDQAQQQLTAAQQQQQAAEEARQQAEQAAQQAAQERAAAEQARQQALLEQQNLRQQMQQAQAQAQQAQTAAQQAEMEREQTRQRLLTQLNQVLQTKDTARGLIVNMSDVLFDFNKATLKPGARERLARVAGILLAYPDLHLQIEGHTDNIGSDSYNMQLSDRRAQTVRDYLVSQGVSAGNVASRGLGKSDPVASNDTAAGRQMNRRVELVVSGQSIQANVQTPGGPAGTPGTSATGTTVNRTYTNQTYGTTSSTTNTTQPATPVQQPMTSQPATSPNEPLTQPASTQPIYPPKQPAPSTPPSAPSIPPQ